MTLNPRIPGKLNKKQLQAVISEKKRLLVLAGAGSGKTETLLRKLLYLVQEKGVSPASILAITFTKNATNEMIDRLILASPAGDEYSKILNNKQLNKVEKDHHRFQYQNKHKWIAGLTIKTFHGFCYSMLRNHGVNEFDNKFRVISDEKRSEETESSRFMAPLSIFEAIHKTLIEKCEEREYLLRLKRYILDYFVDKGFPTQSDKGAFFPQGKIYTALDGTRVRSKSEQYIADWLFRHSISYQYEPSLTVGDFPFHPDFYIPEANLYLEHVSNKSYPMRDKEEQFTKGKILLVKTFESMTRDTAYFNHVLDEIVRGRLPVNYHSNKVLSFKEEFNGYHEEIRDFVAQLMRVNDMIKVENIAPKKVLAQARKDQHERVREFYELAIPVLAEYQHFCTDKSYLDFNDMIIRSASLLAHEADIGQLYRSKYRYILVDEFQDVNKLQVQLIKLLLTEETQLFCVGDDWQSIYGFRGSNVAYIIDFKQHFPKAQTIIFKLNYRSTKHIVGASNEVIKHNKYKIDKEIHSNNRSEHKIVVYTGKDEEDKLRFCHEQVGKLIEEGMQQEDILFLFRRSKMYKPYHQVLKRQYPGVQGKTIHAAKGLEAKAVFIIGLSEGYGGFPDIWLEDRIFQHIRKANHDLLMEEERRLFYVAITRARVKLFLISEQGNESSFLREIPSVFTVRTAAEQDIVQRRANTCPDCYSRLETLWIACPYCGRKVSGQGS